MLSPDSKVMHAATAAIGPEDLCKRRRDFSGWASLAGEQPLVRRMGNTQEPPGGTRTTGPTAS